MDCSAPNKSCCSLVSSLYVGSLHLRLKQVLEAGKKGVYCRCWMSGTFPACDGTHAKHNDATGDNVGPLIVSAAKEE